MKVLLTGGGTGGHITPLLAVAQKLKQLDPSIQVVYVGERNSKFANMTAGQTDFNQHYRIFAGKFRRYHGESWLKRLFDIKTNLLNLRDLCYFLIGTIQSWFLLRRIKPDVILLKGGFVGVPIGLASHGRYPMLSHDSDALPGLANRLVGRWVTIHAVAQAPSTYNYPPEQTVQVGVLVGQAYRLVTERLQQQYKAQLDLPADSLVLFVTGGSGGASSINIAIKQQLDRLFEAYPKLFVLHQVGIGKEGDIDGYQHPRLRVETLVKNLYLYSGAADLIVARAGATNLAEFGVQAKATIVVPNPLLTGGHQLKNADELSKHHAIKVVNEDDLVKEQGRALGQAISQLLDDPKQRQELGQKLHQLTIVDGSEHLAKLLIKSVQTKDKK